MSPLLFALAVEPLACSARLGNEYGGITSRNKQHYIALYADDMLLFLKNAEEEFTGAKSLLERFGRISGLRVNWEKRVYSQ